MDVFRYFWNRSKYFERRGIPGPKVESVFTGNLRELQHDKRPISHRLLEWEEKYGKTFGYFEGSQKVICSSDLSVLRDVFINKFENFHSRKVRFLFEILENCQFFPLFFLSIYPIKFLLLFVVALSPK